MGKMIVIDDTLERYAVVPEGFLKNLLYNISEQFEYVARIDGEVNFDNTLEKDLISVAYAIRENDDVIALSQNQGLANILAAKKAIDDIVVSGLANYYSLVTSHGVGINSKLLIGQNRGFQLNVALKDGATITVYLPGAFIKHIRESLYCVGGDSDGSTFIETPDKIIDGKYYARRAETALGANLLLSVFGSASPQYVGPGAVYASIISAQENFGLYSRNKSGDYELALEFLYVKATDINNMMEETNKSYQLLVESFTTVMPGLSDALMIRSRAIEELNSVRPLFLVQSGATVGDKLKTGKSLQSYINAIDGIESDSEIMEISNVFSSLLSFGELAQITDNSIESVGAEAFSVNDVLTDQADYIRLSNGFIPRALSNVFTSRVEEIITDVNTKTYGDIGIRLENGENTEADYKLIEVQAERAIKDLEKSVEQIVGELSSSDYTQLSASLLDLRRDYDQKIAIISETIGQSLQLAAKAAEMLSLVNNIVNYPVVSGKYGQVLGTVRDFMTYSYNASKRLYNVQFDVDAMYSALGKVALRTSDARGSGRLFEANLGDVNALGGYDGDAHTKIYPTKDSSFSKSDLNAAKSGKPIVVFDSVSQESTKSWYNVGARQLTFQQAIRQTQKINSKTVEIVPNVVSTVPSGCYFEEFGSGIVGLLETLLNHEAIKASSSILETIDSYQSILKDQKDAMKSLSVNVAYLKAKNTELGVNRFLLTYYKRVLEASKSGLSPVRLYAEEGDKFSYMDYLNICSLVSSSNLSVKKEVKDDAKEKVDAASKEIESITERLKLCSNVFDTYKDGQIMEITSAGRAQLTDQNVSFGVQAVEFSYLESTTYTKFIMNLDDYTLSKDATSPTSRFDFNKILEEVLDGSWSNLFAILKDDEWIILCPGTINSSKVSSIPLESMKSELLRALSEQKKVLESNENYEINVYLGSDKVETSGEIYTAAFAASYKVNDEGIIFDSIVKRNIVVNKSITLLGYSCTLQRVLSITNSYYLPVAMKNSLKQQIARAFKLETISELKKSFNELDLSFLTKQEQSQLRNLVFGNDVKLVNEESLLLAILASSLMSDVTYASLLAFDYKNASEILSREACGLLTEVAND